MGLDRNSNSDAGRGNAPSQTKASEGYEYVMPYEKGRWLPAYTGGMGKCAKDWDPDFGQAEDEVGNDNDADRY